MVIQNSEVQLTSKSSFKATTKIDYEVSQTPAIKFGDITFAQAGEDGEVKEVEEKGTGELASANRQTRMETLHYLLRVLLLGKIFRENNDFCDLLREYFQNNMGYLETTSMSYEHTESQDLTFQAKGTAITADGRKLSFDYGFAMSESFREEFKSFESDFVKFVDPLVINLKDSPTRISDQVFCFDLDGDGVEDEIHQLERGSGFLALDRNEDGEINDGTELFGAKTGDGFRELQIFDEDGNGWIDENDSIFEKLRVWTLNESGEMELYTLKESDVGAIYLGRARTDFVDHDDDHNVRAAMRETGIFLHESDGRAGSVQHVDFAT